MPDRFGKDALARAVRVFGRDEVDQADAARGERPEFAVERERVGERDSNRRFAVAGPPGERYQLSLHQRGEHDVIDVGHRIGEHQATLDQHVGFR